MHDCIVIALAHFPKVLLIFPLSVLLENPKFTFCNRVTLALTNCIVSVMYMYVLLHCSAVRCYCKEMKHTQMKDVICTPLGVEMRKSMLK